MFVRKIESITDLLHFTRLGMNVPTSRTDVGVSEQILNEFRMMRIALVPKSCRAQ